MRWSIGLFNQRGLMSACLAVSLLLFPQPFCTRGPKFPGSARAHKCLSRTLGVWPPQLMQDLCRLCQELRSCYSNTRWFAQPRCLRIWGRLSRDLGCAFNPGNPGSLWHFLQPLCHGAGVGTGSSTASGVPQHLPSDLAQPTLVQYFVV